MTTYTVHLYREMHLVFRDIDAETPESAARLAAGLNTDTAESCANCCGLSYRAHVVPKAATPPMHRNWCGCVPTAARSGPLRSTSRIAIARIGPTRPSGLHAAHAQRPVGRAG